MNKAAVDLLRTVGVLYIVGFLHLMNYVQGYPGYQNKVTYGLTVIALASFTILSGYLLGLKSVDLSAQGLISFYRRRLVRIYPPLVLAVVMLTAVFFLDLEMAAKTLLLVGALIPPAPLTIWYISMLVLFYLAAPFLINAAAQGQKRYLLTSAVLVSAMLAIHYVNGLLDPRTIIYFPCFVLGIGLAQRPLNTSGRWPIVIGALTALSYGFSLYFPEATWETSLASLPLAFFGSWLALILCVNLRIPAWSTDALAFLSQASLFMYLFHRVVYRFFKFAFGTLEPAQGLLLMVLVALPIVVVGSWIGQTLYERYVVPKLLDRKTSPVAVR